MTNEVYPVVTAHIVHTNGGLCLHFDCNLFMSNVTNKMTKTEEEIRQ